MVVVGVAVVTGITASVWALQTVGSNTSGSEVASGFNHQQASDALLNREAPSGAKPPASHFPTTIRRPTGPPRVATGTTDSHGNAITVSCSTCHTTRPPNSHNKTPADLTEFHAGMKFSHGNVSCLSCHNSVDYDALKLADGTRVEFVNVMKLCAQCHGSQMKDYEHGVHGGMNGFWDTTRGPREKNNCVDCHNPHAPQFPKMRPTFKPKDRFLDGRKAAH